jgi:hypothetical protein
MSLINSAKTRISSAVQSTKVQATALVTTLAIASTPAMADTDNGGTTLTIPTFITGDEVSGQVGWFELLQNTVLHYINEYIMPLMLVGFGIGWLFFFLFMGNRKAKGSVAS